MPIPSLRPSVPSHGEPARPALARFNIVLANEDTAEAVVLDSTPDANQATIAFHQTRQRLIHERVRGQLVLVQHDQGTHMLLREPLGTAAGGAPKTAIRSENLARIVHPGGGKSRECRTRYLGL